jgi:hypothetical protein
MIFRTLFAITDLNCTEPLKPRAKLYVAVDKILPFCFQTSVFSSFQRFFNSYALFPFSLGLPPKPGAFILWPLPFLPRLTVDIFYIIKLVGILKKVTGPDIMMLYYYI